MVYASLRSLRLINIDQHGYLSSNTRLGLSHAGLCVSMGSGKALKSTRNDTSLVFGATGVRTPPSPPQVGLAAQAAVPTFPDGVVDRNVRRVLIVSVGRSASTLVGAMLDRRPGTLYFFVSLGFSRVSLFTPTP